ncbi:MAG: hypothetical protein ACI9HE_003128 [Planctomycetota bacterium]|jgi:hypothetical protein
MKRAQLTKLSGEHTGVKIPKDSAGGCNYNDNVVISDCDTCDEYLE